MKVAGIHRRSLWVAPDEPEGGAVFVIDQRQLPHQLVIARLDSVAAVRRAIADMWVRGAPLIGASAAYGLALQCRMAADDHALRQTQALLDSARPTAVNLAWATRRMVQALLPLPVADRCAAAWQEAAAIAEEDVATNAAIGRHGLGLLQALAARHPGRSLNVLTHCNAGWLATVDWGTALAPIYQAQAAGLAVHVWVDETRPRNQGASLTAWELGQQGVAHTVIADNTGGHLMQHGQVDVVIVGADRVTARGDVCNKIGTYLKALAAHDNGVPFYVAMPLSTLDLGLQDGLAEIPIEHRSPRELTHISGRDAQGVLAELQLVPDGSPALNPAFDVTPARLVSGLITERGVVAATARALQALAWPVGQTAAAAQAGRASKTTLNPTLRPATAADAARVATLLIDTRLAFMPYAPTARPDAELRQWVASQLLPSGGVTVAEWHGQVVAVMATQRSDMCSWINQMAVDPAQVGQGIGSLLLAHALRSLPAPLRLYTFQANLGARRFYERHGFLPITFTDGQDNEEHCPDVLYERRDTGLRPRPAAGRRSAGEGGSPHGAAR